MHDSSIVYNCIICTYFEASEGTVVFGPSAQPTRIKR